MPAMSARFMKALLSAGMALALVSCAATADRTIPTAEQRQPATFAEDRAAILAMAGNFHVTFDMRETVSFIADYEPSKPKFSEGKEVVRVIEDTGRVIRLQHMLVVNGRGGQPMVIKHWRQDWEYEPASVLVFVGDDRWEARPVPVAARAGVWAQTVWQTDDGPRYGGLGRWAYVNGVAQWTSERTWRPMSRRDSTRETPFAHYDGTNRHAVTFDGWVHEQDNAKVGARNGTLQTFVHEVVTNAYRRTDDFPAAAADAYWEKTKDYWTKVRGLWDAKIARERGILLADEANSTGSTGGDRRGPGLLEISMDLANGKMSAADADASAARIIAALPTAQLAQSRDAAP